MALDAFSPDVQGAIFPGSAPQAAPGTPVAEPAISAQPPYSPEQIGKQYEVVGALQGQELQKKQQLLEEQRAEREKIRQRYEPQLAEAGKPVEFKPSQATAGELTMLFGMIGAMGAMGGVGSYTSAIGAMNAMGGMLKGFNEGRKDVFEQEKVIYDKKMQENKLHFDRINAAFDRAMKASVDGLTPAQQQLERDLTALGANVLAEQAKLNGMTKTYEMWRTARNNYDQRSSQLAPVSIIGPDGKPELITRREFERRTSAGVVMRPAPKEGAAGTGKATQQQFIVQRAINALGGAASAVEGITKLPVGTTTGILPNLTSKDGLFNYVRNSLGNTLIDVETDNLNTLFAGLGRNLAAIEASGTATGLKNLSDSLQSGVFIRAGVDDPYKVALKLADIKRIAIENLQPAIDSGLLTPDQKSAATNLVARMERAVPFSVNDVLEARNRILAEERGEAVPTIGQATTQAVQQKPSLEQFIRAAKEQNPSYSDDEITAIYNQKYGGR